jgi:dihydrofolate synthase/folylpolyglutamate synthase
VILDRARELDSPVWLIGKDFEFAIEGPPFDQRFRYQSPALRLGPTPLALHGAYQGENAAVAVALADLLSARMTGIDAAVIERGLNTVRWPCRLDRVLDDPPVIVDATHNPAGAHRTAQAIPRCVTLLALSGDKDAANILHALAPITTLFVLSQFHGERAMPVEQLADAAQGITYRYVPNLTDAIALGMALASRDTPLLITGSIFAAGEARRLLTERYGAPPLRF